MKSLHSRAAYHAPSAPIRASPGRQASNPQFVGQHVGQGATTSGRVCAAATEPAASAASTSAANGTAPTDKSAPAAGFTNRQKFVVPDGARDAFMQAWDAREAYMKQQRGFQGFDIHENGEGHITVESRWASIPEWEAYNLSGTARRQHLPSGIKQLVPEPGEGFPEDFVPFEDLNTIVQARYPKKKK